jgi:zinc transporter ZupT
MYASGNDAVFVRDRVIGASCHRAVIEVAKVGGLSPLWLAFVQTFAAGAILMMLANTMIPEAYEHGGNLAGVFRVLGFAVRVWVIVLERSGTG